MAAAAWRDFKGRQLVLYFYAKADTPRLHPGSH
jgi:hypothetical protein